jgi:hypothetical protein
MWNVHGSRCMANSPQDPIAVRLKSKGIHDGVELAGSGREVARINAALKAIQPV